MKLGIISPYWLPRAGGAEVYAYRLARALLTRGHEVRVATTTPASDDRDNGTLDVLRASQPVSLEDEDSCRAWYRHLLPWLRAQRFSHVLINAPLSRPFHAHARELYDCVRESGSSLGALHYDLGREIAAELSWSYGISGSWETAATRTLEKARAHVTTVGEAAGYRALESPLFFQPDFVISCSAWSDRFIDPLQRTPRAVLHPLLEMSDWMNDNDHTGSQALESLTLESPTLTPVAIAFINPLPHKGVQRLVELMRTSPPGWTFRVLQGGGDSVATFLHAIRETAAFRAGRVHTLTYCLEMRHFYERTGLLLFPSLYEGYGMAAVEALCSGTPVVASDYPAIREGVGDGACIVPFTASNEHWRRASEQVLNERARWVTKAKARAVVLYERQEQEFDALLHFLTSVSTSAATPTRNTEAWT